MDNMLSQSPTCPYCNQSDQTYKVSLLYLEGSARLNRREMTDQPELEAVLNDLLTTESTSAEQKQVISSLVKAFEPPSGSRQVARRIHPDWLILFVCAVGLIIAYQSGSSRPGDLSIIVTLLSASLLVYLLVRRPVIMRYETQNSQDEFEKKNVEKAVARWMRLYFCSRDQTVFDPDENRFVPLEHIEELMKSS